MQKLLRKIDRLKSDDPTSPMTDKTPMDRRIEEVCIHTRTVTHAHTNPTMHTYAHTHMHTHTHTQLEEELDKLNVECEQLKEQTIVSPLQYPGSLTHHHTSTLSHIYTTLTHKHTSLPHTAISQHLIHAFTPPQNHLTSHHTHPHSPTQPRHAHPHTPTGG